VQVQKLFFLIDKRAAADVGGPHFEFRPYDYGPFDSNVYVAIEALAARGLAAVHRPPEFRMKKFRLTQDGQARGDEVFQSLPPGVQDFMTRACDFVRNTPFAELVSAIYKAYPEMRERSVFREIG
jgi:hypothetical protein